MSSSPNNQKSLNKSFSQIGFLGRISKKQYWVILIILFAIISLLMAGLLWVFPANTIGYNLALGFLTSSVFMILTIVFLSWLLDVRDSTEWHTVRDEVFFRIKLELSTLFDLATEYFEGGFELKVELMQERDKQKNMDLIVKGLEKLSNSGVVANNLIVVHFFKDSQEIENFQNVDKKITDIQGLYSRHLPADIIVSLMKLQECLWTLESFKEFHDNFTNSQLFSNPLISAAKDTYENYKVEMLKAPLVSLLGEIQKLYSFQEFKFNYPPILT